jgi:chemotaxis response regulator CheB
VHSPQNDPKRNRILADKGMMPWLLQRARPLPVVQATEGLQVRPNHVYALPPKSDMSILHGALHLFKPAAPRGQHLPIEFFLRSLTMDHRQHAVGILLSGVGSDRTAGLLAIKENAGLTPARKQTTPYAHSCVRKRTDNIVTARHAVQSQRVRKHAKGRLSVPPSAMESNSDRP